MSGICRTGPAGAEPAAVSPRKRAFAASGPPKTDRCSREGQIPQQTPKQTLQIRGSLGDLLVRIGSSKPANWTDLPDFPGIYAICLPDWGNHSFTTRDKRSRILEAGPTDILYIGKAKGEKGMLRKRVRQLAGFTATHAITAMVSGSDSAAVEHFVDGVELP